MKRFLGTTEGVAFLALAGCVLTGTVFAWLVLGYDPERQFGIAPSVAERVGTAYVPVVVASAVVFRNHLVTLVSVNAPAKLHRVKSGLWLVYLLMAGGVSAALFALAYLASCPSEQSGQWILAGCAAVWGGSVGAVIERVFKAQPPGP